MNPESRKASSILSSGAAPEGSLGAECPRSPLEIRRGGRLMRDLENLRSNGLETADRIDKLFKKNRELKDLAKSEFRLIRGRKNPHARIVRNATMIFTCENKPIE